MKKTQYNVTFGGIGGQGIITASELLGWAALYDRYSVKKSEVHGMSQRGGSVESHVRFGKGVFSPLLGAGQADFLLCFHEDEHARLALFLKDDGVDLFEWLDKAQAMIDNPKMLNTALMGVLAAYLPIQQPSWDKAFETVFPEKIRRHNQDIFNKARQAAQTAMNPKKRGRDFKNEEMIYDLERND
ncbi:MAG TPA: pyruvate ferredoxin oxidoreductase [Phycisphaerales bacterium]|nr:pyruvate ferredoxin oxidoreductase [Phycisphaerales bacterium]